MTKEQPTREEMISSLEWNLNNPFYLFMLGSNVLRKDQNAFGQFGHSAGESVYSSLISGEESDKLRKKMYDGEMKEAEALGLADRPEYPSNYEISKYSVRLINEAVMNLPLGNLEKALGNIAQGVDLKIPEALKGYVGMEEGLDDETRKMVMTYKQLSMEAIRRGTAFRIMDMNKYADINAQAGKLNEMYEKPNEPHLKAA